MFIYAWLSRKKIEYHISFEHVLTYRIFNKVLLRSDKIPYDCTKASAPKECAGGSHDFRASIVAFRKCEDNLVPWVLKNGEKCEKGEPKQFGTSKPKLG